ncbi:MAG: hypothetical protein OH337_04035 [Candidatus Parvarchaeota archaeon]|nr:hypothetical protein [Candidatus Haiyanarchaeum thermophilum]
MSLEIKWKNKKKALKRAVKLADEILDSRKDIYQDNWALMSLDALLCGAYYKVNRAMFTSEPSKKLDDLLDALNYLRFAIVRLMEADRKQ